MEKLQMKSFGKYLVALFVLVLVVSAFPAQPASAGPGNGNNPDGSFVTGGGWFDSAASAYMPHPGTSVVTPANIGVDWFSPDLRGGGYVTFVEGPAVPPLGTGSLEMGTTSGSDKAQLFNYDYIGTPLAEIGDISYATYRDSSSTNSAVQYPAINLEVDYVGDGSSYTTLVWEPVYPYGASNLAVDTWQTWDTFAPSQTGFGGGWWSSRDIPGVCAFNCFVDWQTILENNPNAKIKYGFGVNVGSGWVGAFTGAVDALSLTVNGEKTVYDFEPVSSPTGKANFAFNSKLKNGDSHGGQVEFQFKAGDLNFHSSGYDWMEFDPDGSSVQFGGLGSLNGVDGYQFTVSATDGSPDTFGIRIWNADDGTVVYDNGVGQAIGGGSIVVHAK